MAEWWLLDEPTQDRIADFIDTASDLVINNFEAHGNENSLTAALGQELSRRPLLLGDTTVTFRFRNFLEQQEEPLVGADGGFLVTITNSEGTYEKGVFYQAKRFAKYSATRSLRMTRKDAGRLKRQVSDMLEITSESIVLAQTPARFFAVDADSIASEPIENLRSPLSNVRLITLGTYLGKWVARCTRGDMRENFLDGLKKPRGFLKFLFEMEIETKQRPLLTDGGRPIDLDSIPRDQIPEPRWTRRE
jgi:hypothetical protein